MNDGHRSDRAVAARQPSRRQIGWFGIVAAGWLVFAVSITLVRALPGAFGRSPVPLGSGLPGLIGHVGLGMALTGSILCFIWALRGGGRRLVRAAVVVLVASVAVLSATEVAQVATGTRESSLGDGIANLVGAMLVTGLLVLGFERRPAPRIATGFMAVALVALVASIVAVAIPNDRPLNPNRVEPVPSTAENDPCVARFIERTPPTGTLDGDPSTPRSEPLAHFDLRAGSLSSVGRLPPIELAPEGEIQLLDGIGARFQGEPDALRSTAPADGLVASLAATEAFTVAAWVRPDEADQGGPTRIVSISSGTSRFATNVHLGAHEGQLSVRIRSRCDPRIWLVGGRLGAEPTHVALTYDDGELTAYVDGRVVMEASLVRSGLDSWRSGLPLVVGNVGSLDRPFLGVVAEASIWDRALAEGELADLARSPAIRLALEP